jgi:ammonium transporter, Amt family
VIHPSLLLALEDAAPSVVPADTAWMLVSTALVLLMTPALAFFYGGLVRSKNSLNTMMMSFAALGVVGIVWALLAYSLAFGEGNAWIGGTANALLNGVGTEAKGTIPHVLFMAYQGTFAIITAALISGAIVERMRFGPYLAFITLWTLFVYAPVAHWVWGGGWLMTRGVLDFAGGTVVHINAGIAGLVGALMIGKRIGYNKDVMAPHSMTLTMVGASLLWVGWFGFNAGSNLEANAYAVLAMVNTFVATAAAAVTWIVLETLLRGKASMLGAVSGAVTGLVAVTPAAGFAGPMGAIVLGIVATCVCYFFVSVVKNKFGYDDSLDVFGIHCIGGIIGALGTGILVNPALGGAGIVDYSTADFAAGYAGTATQLWSQFKGVLVTVLWSGIGSAILYKIVDLIIGLRPTADAEREGLDLTSHGEAAYHS